MYNLAVCNILYYYNVYMCVFVCILIQFIFYV